jgi:hypothetical protein
MQPLGKQMTYVHRLPLIDYDAHARRELHAERQNDTEQLFGLAFALDYHRRDHSHVRLEFSVHARKAVQGE